MWPGGGQDIQQTPLSTLYESSTATDADQLIHPFPLPTSYFASLPPSTPSAAAASGLPQQQHFQQQQRTGRPTWRSGTSGPLPLTAPLPQLSGQQLPPFASPARFFPQAQTAPLPHQHHLQHQHQHAFPSAAAGAGLLVNPASAAMFSSMRPSALPQHTTAPAMGRFAAMQANYGSPMELPLGWGGLGLGGAPLRPGRGGRGRRGRGGGRGFEEGGRHSQQADTVIQHIINAIRSLPLNVPCLDTAIAAGLGTLDSRSAAVLFKQLAHANMDHRVWELFNALRTLRACGTGGELMSLLDVYSYTAMISLCSNNRDVALAQELSREMVAFGIQRNVHTFSALMNVAIKAQQYQLALDIFEEMQVAGCQPNLVTFNTLIDVYGKLNKWTEAVRVLNTMRALGIEPVIRTYNTLMIACNSSSQWQEALRVYQQVVESGLRPNTTTFNALIAAYSKAGNIDKVMEVFQQMVRSGCERSVITYSTLISACEKAGEWELALQLFGRMPQDKVSPNTITFNSLITACAQGSQWDRAEEVFEQMGRLNCQPDVVSYTALITAYGRGAQWRRALDAFNRMQQARCPPDHVVYEAVIEVLWDTGVGVAQRRAIGLNRTSVNQGLARQQQQPLAGPPLRPAEGVDPSFDSSDSPSPPQGLSAFRQRGQSSMSGPTASSEGRSSSSLALAGSMSSSSQRGRARPGQQQQQQQQQQWSGDAAELVLGASSSSNMAMVSLLCWLADARELVRRRGPNCLPSRLILRFGRARQRELAPSGATLRTIILGWLKSHRSPFKVPADPSALTTPSAFTTNQLEASGREVEEWLASPTSTVVSAPTSASLAAAAAAPSREAASGVSQAQAGADGKERARVSVGDALARSLDLFCTPPADGREDPEQTAAMTGDLALEVQCCTAFSAVQRFEARYCLNVTAMGPVYTALRHDLITSFFKLGATLRCRRSLLHDAVLLLDRVMSSAVQLRPDMHLTALCATLLLVSRQPPPPGLPLSLPSSPPSRLQRTTPQPSFPPPPAVASALSALPTSSAGQAAQQAAQAQAAGSATSWRAEEGGEGAGGASAEARDKQAAEGEVRTQDGIPTEAALSSVTGLTVGSLRSCQSTILSTLGQDTTAISAVHSLHIYLARLGLATQRWQLMDDDEELSKEGAGPSTTAQPSQAPPEPSPQQQHAQQAQHAQHASDAPTAPTTGTPASTAHQQQQQQQQQAATASTVGEQQLGSPQHAAAAAAAAAAAVLGGPPAGSGDLELDAYTLLDAAVAATDFLNFRPSVTAAAVLYTARMRAGELPLWPSSLITVTGVRTTPSAPSTSGLGGDKGHGSGSNNASMELCAAISAAQKLLLGGSSGA